MALPNVKQVCFFAKNDVAYVNSSGAPVPVDLGEIMSFATCQSTYGFAPDGVNSYLGFSSQFISTWQAAKANPSLPPEEQAILGSTGNPYSTAAQINQALNALNNGPKSEMTFVFGLQPEEISDPFNFMLDPESTNALTQIAQELDEFSKQAGPGKRLRIVIRFASEMNTKENTTWGLGNPKANAEDFIKAYQEVRRVFRSVSPFFLMSFSPALRVDLDPDEIENFYPGVANIDFLSGTWYFGGTGTLDGVFAHLSHYYATYKTKVLQNGSHFALDEWGGALSTDDISPPLTEVSNGQTLTNGAGTPIGWEAGGGHEQALSEMAQRLASLQSDGISLDYATLFLQKKWNPRKVITLPFH